MKDFARSLYSSPAWKKCREAYRKSVGGLCERCYAQGMYTPGVIVHHRIHLTPDNVTDPTITLDPNNLELLCRDCHAAEHEVQLGRPKNVVGIKGRYYIDSDGKVVTNSQLMLPQEPKVVTP